MEKLNFNKVVATATRAARRGEGPAQIVIGPDQVAGVGGSGTGGGNYNFLKIY
jgi:hypothetical protein